MTVLIVIILMLVGTGVFGLLVYFGARKLMYAEDRQTPQVIRKMQTPYRIREIEKHFKEGCSKWTEYYNGYEDLDEITDYFVKRGYKVTRNPYGKHNPTIWRISK